MISLVSFAAASGLSFTPFQIGIFIRLLINAPLFWTSERLNEHAPYGGWMKMMLSITSHQPYSVTGLYSYTADIRDTLEMGSQC